MRLLIFISFILGLPAYSASTSNKTAHSPTKGAVNCEPTDEHQQLAGTVLKAVTAMKGCPNFSKLEGLCSLIENPRNDPSDGNPFDYTYERSIYEAACADPSRDTPEIMQQKIQAMWSAYEDRLTCKTFDVTNGSVLKFAVNVKEWQFLDDAIKKWKVNLNRVDPSDNRTLLDYIDYLKPKYTGSDIEIMLDAYYKKLVKAGAKRKSEL